MIHEILRERISAIERETSVPAIEETRKLREIGKIEREREGLKTGLPKMERRGEERQRMNYGGQEIG